MKQEQVLVLGCFCSRGLFPASVRAFTGGIYWANIGRIVYGISEARLLELTGADDKNPTFSMGADKVIAAGQKAIRLEGPVLEMETEIVAVHEGFWNKK